MGEITICVKCKFLNKLGSMWCDHLCKGVSLEEGIDFVTGKKGYKHLNSLGDVSIIDNPDPYCRSINDGNCKYYKPKGK